MKEELEYRVENLESILRIIGKVLAILGIFALGIFYGYLWWGL